jgi:hypothetical protein
VNCKNPVVREAHPINDCQPCILRDPSRAGWIGAHVEVPELLTPHKSAIGVPKRLLIITGHFALVGFPLCSTLQMSRENAARKYPSGYLTLREALRRVLISQHQSAGIDLLVIFQRISQGKVARF